MKKLLFPILLIILTVSCSKSEQFKRVKSIDHLPEAIQNLISKDFKNFPISYVSYRKIKQWKGIELTHLIHQIYVDSAGKEKDYIFYMKGKGHRIDYSATGLERKKSLLILLDSEPKLMDLFRKTPDKFAYFVSDFAPEALVIIYKKYKEGDPEAYKDIFEIQYENIQKKYSVGTSLDTFGNDYRFTWLTVDPSSEPDDEGNYFNNLYVNIFSSNPDEPFKIKKIPVEKKMNIRDE